jgi:riboflavin biosynthesis pyrimidine reductase
MSVLRLVLPGTAEVGDLDDTRTDVIQALADLYAYPAPIPATGWVRANMVTTLDGAATARAEQYSRPQPKHDFADRRAAQHQPATARLAFITRSGDLPASSGVHAPGSETLVITCAAADLVALRNRFGSDRVLVSGDEHVDPAIATAHLAARGLRRILLEGGPHLLADFVASDRLDELCLTVSPLMVGGEGPRVAVGNGGALDFRLAHLVEAGGTLLTRWLVHR